MFLLTTLLKRMSLLASVRLALSLTLLKTATYSHFTSKVSMVTVTLALLCHAISKITLPENHHKENYTQKRQGKLIRNIQVILKSSISKKVVCNIQPSDVTVIIVIAKVKRLVFGNRKLSFLNATP